MSQALDIDFTPHDWPDGSVRWSASFHDRESHRISATGGLRSPRECLMWALYSALACQDCRTASIHWHGGCDCTCHGGVALGRGVES